MLTRLFRITEFRQLIGWTVRQKKSKEYINNQFNLGWLERSLIAIQKDIVEQQKLNMPWYIHRAHQNLADKKALGPSIWKFLPPHNFGMADAINFPLNVIDSICAHFFTGLEANLKLIGDFCSIFWQISTVNLSKPSISKFILAAVLSPISFTLHLFSQSFYYLADIAMYTRNAIDAFTRLISTGIGKITALCGDKHEYPSAWDCFTSFASNIFHLAPAIVIGVSSVYFPFLPAFFSAVKSVIAVELAAAIVATTVAIAGQAWSILVSLFSNSAFDKRMDNKKYTEQTTNKTAQNNRAAHQPEHRPRKPSSHLVVDTSLARNNDAPSSGRTTASTATGSSSVDSPSSASRSEAIVVYTDVQPFSAPEASIMRRSP